MKRLIAFLAGFLVLVCVSSVFAAGTVTANKLSLGPGKSAIVISWTADSSAATVPSFKIGVLTGNTGESKPMMSECIGSYMYVGETVAGGTAPTNGYAITLKDASGLDLAGALLGTLSSSAVQSFNFGNQTAGYPVVAGDITFALTGNLVNSATGTLTVYFVGTK